MKGQGACWTTEEPPTVQGWVGEEQTAKESEEDWPEAEEKSGECGITKTRREEYLKEENVGSSVKCC